MNRRVDRGNATRQQVIETATRLFTEQGYEAVSVEALLVACGISKGALYHHFSGKEAVFTAVLEATEDRIVTTLVAAGEGAPDLLAALQAGARAWLDLAARDATVRRVVLLDAPGAIGWAAWRALDERYTLGLIRGVLAGIGGMPVAELDTRAHLLLATLVEAALLIACAPEDEAVARASAAAVERLISALAAGGADAIS